MRLPTVKIETTRLSPTEAPPQPLPSTEPTTKPEKIPAFIPIPNKDDDPFEKPCTSPIPGICPATNSTLLEKLHLKPSLNLNSN